MGDMSGARPRVAITELDVQAPVQMVLDLLMASDGLCNTFGVGRQAADVADTFGRGALGISKKGS